MPMRIVDLRDQNPLLDIASYGRRGPGHRPLSKAEIEHISRTVRRVPEVMIKVSGGARTLRGVEDHLDYIGREGEGEVETDDGQRLQEKGFERELLKDWDLDLDLEARRRHTERGDRRRTQAPPSSSTTWSFRCQGTSPQFSRRIRVSAHEKLSAVPASKGPSCGRALGGLRPAAIARSVCRRRASRSRSRSQSFRSSLSNPFSCNRCPSSVSTSPSPSRPM